MRSLTLVFGILLVVLGIVALSYQSITFFTTERVVDAGPFQIDFKKPHTIVLHPIVGVVSVIAGVVLMLGSRPATR
jgi:hypothetical protein